MTKWSGHILAIFLVAFVLRAVFAVSRPPDIEFPDGRDYDAIARSFLAGNGLIEAEDRKASRAPGYSLFLAAIYKAFPATPISVRLVQALLGSISCVLVAKFGKLSFNSSAGRYAGWLACFYPFLIFYSGLVLAETLFIFLFIVGVYLLEGLRRDEVSLTDAEGTIYAYLRQDKAFFAGVILGLGILVRASLFLFLPFYVVFWLAMAKRRAMAAARVAIVAVGVCVALLPWWARNYRLFGHFVPTTLQVGESLYEANSPGADGGPRMDEIERDAGWEAVRRSFMKNLLDESPRDDRVPDTRLDRFAVLEYERNRFFRDEALAYMTGNLGRTAWLAVVKLGRFWNVVPNYRRYRTPTYCAVSVISYVPVMLLGIWGFVAACRGSREYLALLSPILYYALLHTVFVGSIRYRTPVMPFVMLFSGYGAAQLVLALRNRGCHRSGEAMG